LLCYLHIVHIVGVDVWKILCNIKDHLSCLMYDTIWAPPTIDPAADFISGDVMVAGHYCTCCCWWSVNMWLSLLFKMFLSQHQGRWLTGVEPPLGPQKVLGSNFKPRGVQVKFLLALCHWAWLAGAANGLSGRVCCCTSETEKEKTQSFLRGELPLLLGAFSFCHYCFIIASLLHW
jgi:hypothetical protein